MIHCLMMKMIEKSGNELLLTYVENWKNYSIGVEVVHKIYHYLVKL